jgi:hypothetical protein
MGEELVHEYGLTWPFATQRNCGQENVKVCLEGNRHSEQLVRRTHLGRQDREFGF